MRWSRLGWAAAIVLLGCDAGGRRLDGVTPGGRDGGVAGDGGTVLGCTPTDTDGDGIADALDGVAADDDSDGDGISDRDEAGKDPCDFLDTDGDGQADFLDTDSDNDGLPDGEERGAGTDPHQADTDGDGVTDLGEVKGTGTDPLNASSTVDPADFFIVLPYEGEQVSRRLRFGTRIEIADVFFLLDMTGSMQGERTNLIRGLVDVVIPGIQNEVRDAWFGAGGFDDYPVEPYGDSGGFGSGADLPFYLLREMRPAMEDVGSWSIRTSSGGCPSDPSVNDIGTITGSPNGRPDILEAVEGLPCHSGYDEPESYVPALYSTATGNGLTWPGGSIPGRTCSADPDAPGVPRGYPCFRPGAQPIIVLFGDAPFHNGPGNSNPYDTFTAPTFDETTAALVDLGARVVSVRSADSFSTIGSDYEMLATATGSVRDDGRPLVFDISATGDGLDRTIVDAVRGLVSDTPQDVSTGVVNGEGNPDDFDATRFIVSLRASEGYRDGMPGTGYERKDERTFYRVIPGTLVEFDVDFKNDVRPPAPTAQIFRAKILVIGNGVTTLEERNVYIVVPPDDGSTILI